MSKASNLSQAQTYYNSPRRSNRMQPQQPLYQPQPIPRIPNYSYNPNLPNTRYNPIPMTTAINTNVPPPIIPPFGTNTMPIHSPRRHLYNTNAINTVTPILSNVNNDSSTNSSNKGSSPLTRNESGVALSIGAQDHMIESSDQSIMAIIREHPSFEQTTKTYKYRKNGKTPRNPVNKRNSNQQIIQNMIPNMANIKREKKECIKKERVKQNNVNVPSNVHHEPDTVYNAVDIEDILLQIKTAMDNDPDPERVKHENYMSLIRRYFRCELSKFSLDWFMHQYYSRYIKLHNAMFKYIRWNAMLQSTNADKYGLGALSSTLVQTQDVENYPRLHCKESQEHKLFRGPPHKKRKLNMPKQLDLTKKRKRNHIDFDETMDKLQDENPKLFNDVMQYKDKDDEELIKKESSDIKPSIKDNLPPINDIHHNNKASLMNTTSRTRRRAMLIHKKANHKSFPLQIEVKGIDEESLAAHNIIRLYHHNECSDTVRYITATECMSDDDGIDLDPIKFERKLRERNITSTNCVSDAESFVNQALPCDPMYLCEQQLMEICNQLIRRRNFLNNGEKQREIIAIKENYEREWKRDQHQINNDKSRKDKFVASFNAEIQHVKDELQSSLLQPMNDPNIINVLMEQGVKPFLASMHCNSIEYNKQNRMQQAQYIRNHTHVEDAHDGIHLKKAHKRSRKKEMMDDSDTDSDEDIPINERLKNEKEQKVEQKMLQLRIHRKNNVSNRLKHRLSIAPHSMVHCGDKKQKHNQEKHNQEKENEVHYGFSGFVTVNNPLRLQSERRLQLKAMLNIEAVDNDEDEDKECWIHYLNKPLTQEGMADIPHSHQCNVMGIHDCLLAQKAYYVPNKEEIKRSNEEWKKQYQYEAHRLSATHHNNNNDDNRDNDGQIIEVMKPINSNQTINKNIISIKDPINSKPTHTIEHNGYSAHNPYYPIPTPASSRSAIYPRNYDPKQYPSPHPSRYMYASPYHSPMSPRRRVSGKGRKGRSGKGVSGKSLSRNTTIGAKRRGLTPNSMRNTRYSSKYTSPNTSNRTNGRSMVWSRSPQQSAVYRQRMQSQRMYTPPQNMNSNNNISHNRLLSSQRLHRYNANYQRIRNNNNTNSSLMQSAANNNNNNSNNSNSNNRSPFPSHYAPYNSSHKY